VGINLNNKCYPKVSKKTSGILLNSIICGQQFKKVETEKFVLKTDLANSCCISFDCSILVIKSIAQSDSEISLIYYKLKKVTDLCLSPIPSNSIGTYLCRNLSVELKVISLNSISHKAIKFPLNSVGEFAVTSILH